MVQPYRTANTDQRIHMVHDINNSVLEFDSHKQSSFIHTKVLNLFSFCYILNPSPTTWFLTCHDKNHVLLGPAKGLLERQASFICHDTPLWKTRKKRERWTFLPPSDQWVIKKANSLG